MAIIIHFQKFTVPGPLLKLSHGAVSMLSGIKSVCVMVGRNHELAHRLTAKDCDMKLCFPFHLSSYL